MGLDPAAAAAGEDADDAWLRDQLHGFWRRFLPPRVSTSEKYLQASFERIDADNSGVVTVAEMRESLVETGAMSAGEARMLCLAVDRDGDGEVTYDEFKLAALASGLLGARRTWDFATSPLELFDLLAVLPFWLELAVRLGLVAVRKDGATASLSALRLLRLLSLIHI